MSTPTPLLAAAVLVLGLAACATSTPATETATPTPRASRTPRPVPTPVPTPTPAECPADAAGTCQIVPSSSNIFGAGHDRVSDPGGGGAGGLPPVWPLPNGATRVVTFPTAIGIVHGRVDQAPPNGPGGEDLLGTNVESLDGISGIVHRDKAMFLVGVFLTDAEPADPAPARLDFTDNEDFDLLEPEIGQTFLIGDGIGRRYLAPAGATRLFLGFAEGMFYEGPPGWYGNNAGQLAVSVEVTTE